jgi:hypothetical protein
MKKMIILFLIAPMISTGQMPKRDSAWLPFKAFIGSWSGEGKGEPGKGKYERSYKFVLGNKFIEVNNKATYPPTANNFKGEVHEGKGLFSYDQARKLCVFRQFHIEGFVTQYCIDSISPDKKTLVFISESIENIPNGYRAKETYRLLSDNEMEETFELAEPRKEFAVYTKVKFVRLK